MIPAPVPGLLLHLLIAITHEIFCKKCLSFYANTGRQRYDNDNIRQLKIFYNEK